MNKRRTRTTNSTIGRQSIAVLTPWWPSETSPQLGTFVRSLTEALQHLGHDIDVLTKEAQLSHGQILKRVSERDVALVHASPRGSLPVAFNKPTVCVFHGRRPLGLPSIRHLIQLSQRTMLYRKCSEAVAVGPLIIDDLPGWLRRKTSIIPNGYDPSLFHPAQAIQTLPRRKILFVGNLTTSKGLTSLMRGISLLLSGTNNRLTLDVVGLGPTREATEDTIRSLGLTDLVTFHGVLPQHQVADLMRASHVFAMVSRPESFGCVYVEALASGLPVVLDQEAGYIKFRPTSQYSFQARFDDPRSIASALSKALQVGTDESIPREVDDLTWEETAESYSRILERVGRKNPTIKDLQGS